MMFFKPQILALLLVSATLLADKPGKIDGTEKLAPGVKRLLEDEQTRQNKDMWPEGFFPNEVSSAYRSENAPKFGLGYYLVPESLADFSTADSLSPGIKSQLFVEKDGKKYYRLFVHPESIKYYAFLKDACQFVSGEKSEFLASPTMSDRSLVVWNQHEPKPTAFIAKVSLDLKILNSPRLVGRSEAERSITNQRALEAIGPEALGKMNFGYFPETAALSLKQERFAQMKDKKLGGQVIREIPESVASGKIQWANMASLMSSTDGKEPLIFKVIEKSGLTPEQFVQRYMVDGFMKTYEELAFNRGLGFEPHAQNLGMELNADFSPTGKWIYKDFGGLWPDPIAMANHPELIKIYQANPKAEVFHFAEGRSYTINGFTNYFRRQVFELMLRRLRKKYPDFTQAVSDGLQKRLDERFFQLAHKWFGLRINKIPTLREMEELRGELTESTNLSRRVSYTHVDDKSLAADFVALKRSQGEWVGLVTNIIPESAARAVGLRANDTGVYLVDRGGRILGYSLFNLFERESFVRTRGISEAFCAEATAFVKL